MMITVYAIGIIGMALMPGLDADGNPHSMSLFHAFYFFTYTATTTGFGEIPYNFTDEQRLWTIICLYMGVIAWLYAIGSIIKLVQNPYLVHAIAEWRFTRSVQRIWSPFYIVCGFGDTGSLLTRGISDHGMMAVIIDSDEERIKALALRDYRVTMPGLCADASVPVHLVNAGIKHPKCLGVIALMADEDLNQKIAVMARFLNPEIKVICRTTSPRHQKHFIAIPGVTIINTFELFASQLRRAVIAPKLHTLSEWFIGARGFSLDKPMQKMRHGHWILCGYGRMGSCIQREFATVNIDTVVVDPIVEHLGEVRQSITAYADAQSLAEADLENAAGLVVGTGSDADNLGILLHAHQFRSNALLIVRQNQHENELAFNAASVDLIMQASLVTARNILRYLIAPSMQHVIDHLESVDPKITVGLLDKLKLSFADVKPHLLSVTIGDDTPAVIAASENGLTIRIADIIRDPNKHDRELVCVPLAITRNSKTTVLPSASEAILKDDVLLFCATMRDVRRVQTTLRSPQRLSYLITGYEEPSGYFFKWLHRMFPHLMQTEKV